MEGENLLLSFGLPLPSMSFNSEAEQFARHRLQKLRPLLLNLHKALMETERVAYEQAYGPIPSKGEYFRLVLGHEWFSWLRPISQFIVRIDELLAAKTPEEAESAEALVQETRRLLNPNAEGDIAEHRYYQAIQQNPDVALMHATLTQLLA
jgi:hypothetical protein